MPTVLLFEDLHWADAGLLDFVEYLLEWSRTLPDLRAHARTPGVARAAARPGVRGRRSFHSHRASSHSPNDSMRSSSTGSPPDSRRRCARGSATAPRACRSTPSRRFACFSTEGARHTRTAVTGSTGRWMRSRCRRRSTALIAARLDGLEPMNAALFEDAAVLGKTFTRRALAPSRDRRGRARASARRARPQGDPDCGGRPALARARAVRLPRRARSERRLRDALAEGAQERAISASPATSRATRSPTTRSSRSSPPTTSRLTEPSPTRRMPPRSERRRADRLDPRRRAGRVARGHEDAERYFERGGGARRRPARRARAARARRRSWPGRAGASSAAARRTSSRPLDLFESAGETHPAARASRPARRDPVRARADRRRNRTDGAGLRRPLGRRARRGPRSARP